MTRPAPLIMSLITLALTGLPGASASATPAKDADSGLSQAILDIEHEWAHANYEIPDKDKDQALSRLEKKEDAVIRRYPGRAEPMVWKAITLATHASVKGGFSALSLARRARELLIHAAKIDPQTLQGSIYTTLGTLYFKVPGWPLGFGDDDKAGALLKKGLEINPTGMEANYFYGAYLFHEGHYQEALDVLQKALNAPDRPDRPVTDKGRRAETRRLIAKVKSEMSD
ncbi:MAG TPA: hypothetical protein VKA13_00225 [Gammaproteobacteria bacterium]|nr:hypothetical protein [Gammaproteobacteria bacterium]